MSRLCIVSHNTVRNAVSTARRALGYRPYEKITPVSHGNGLYRAEQRGDIVEITISRQIPHGVGVYPLLPNG